MYKRQVLRGEEGSNALDLPDRPSDLEQREGRGIRKGNEVAKLYADNTVDVLIYAVEKSLDAYKFGLLHNKQLFIRQLKQNRMGVRTIDEGGMDEGSGMNFSEYVAVLSGNTDLLEKARLEKKIAGLESERQAFVRGKSSSRSQLEYTLGKIGELDERIGRIEKDLEAFRSRAELNEDGSYRNRITPVSYTHLDDPHRGCRSGGNTGRSDRTGRGCRHAERIPAPSAYAGSMAACRAGLGGVRRVARGAGEAVYGRLPALAGNVRIRRTRRTNGRGRSSGEGAGRYIGDASGTRRTGCPAGNIRTCGYGTRCTAGTLSLIHILKSC